MHRDFEGGGNFSNTGLCPVCIKKKQGYIRQTRFSGHHLGAGGLLAHRLVVKTRIIEIVYKTIKFVRSSNESF